MSRELFTASAGSGAGPHSAGGFTLVEILVTILVISIGLLGVAGLHSFSLRNNYDALMRSHASALAADIADRMRSNRDAVYVEAGESEYVIALGASPEVDDDSSRALVDVSEWKDTLDAQLPDGDGSIAVDQDTRTVTIVIQWGERGQDMSFTTETEV